MSFFSAEEINWIALEAADCLLNALPYSEVQAKRILALNAPDGYARVAGLRFRDDNERSDEFRHRILQPAVNQLVLLLPAQFRAFSDELQTAPTSALHFRMRSIEHGLTLLVEAMNIHSGWSLCAGFIR